MTDPLRFSRLKRMAQSAAHYKSYVPPDTASLRAGRAVHSLVLGGDDVICYPGRRAGRAWEEFEAEHASYVILNQTEWDKAHGMAEAVKADENAATIIGGGAAHEQQISWEYSGRACTGRVDVLSLPWLAELKTTKFAKPSWFTREAIRRGYVAQIAWYRTGVELDGRWSYRAREAYIVAVESSPPYPVSVFRLTERALEAGDRLWRGWFEFLRVCEDSDYWPGYTDAVVDLDAPEEDDWETDALEVA